MVAKITSKIILEPLKQNLYSTIDAKQAGFRPGSCCTDHINTMPISIKQCVAHRSDLSMVFIDFEKAFDSIHRGSIWTALRNRALPEKIICIIRAIYVAAKCVILYTNNLSEPFEVRSGYILPPVLFLIVLADVLREAFKLHQASGIRWTMTNFLQHLGYADLIRLFAHKIPELSAMVKSLEVVWASASRKTKTLCWTRKDWSSRQIHVSWQ